MSEHQLISDAAAERQWKASQTLAQRQDDINRFIEALKDMTLNQYQEEVGRTYAPRFVCHALGVAGEAGEIADMVKKSVYHDVEYANIDMLKELGDVLWYVSALARDHGFTLEQVARANIQKLQARYPNGFVAGGGIREEQPAASEVYASFSSERMDVGADIPGGGAA